MLSRDRYMELLVEVDDLIGEVDKTPDEGVREHFFATLTGLDMIHREGLTRLVTRLRESGGKELVELALSDPVVKTLLSLYDLAPLEGAAERPRTGFVPVEHLLRTNPNGR